MHNFTHHIENQPEGLPPQTLDIESPKQFEGPGHRESVLLGAKVMNLFVAEQEKARTDPNTQLRNRLGFQEGFTQLVEQAAHEENPHVALLSFDLDNFKDVNDTLGHDVGDDVLNAFASIMKHAIAVREDEGEVAARLGGDEFAAAIKTVNTLNDRRDKSLSDEEIIDQFSNRLRKDVKVLADKVGIPQLGVSISVVRFREPGFEHETPEEFMKRSDVELYSDKAEKDQR